MASAANSPEIYGPIRQGRVAGRLELPGSKSITQRYLNLALLHGQALRVRRPLLSEDTELYLAGLEQAGFTVRHLPGAVEVTPGLPEAAGGHEEPRRDVFCGAGGTMFRFLTAALAAIPGRFTLDGIPRLRERPIAPLVDALRPLGAQIRYLGREGFAPLAIDGGTFEGGRTRLDAGASSQFLSALLMAALRGRRETVIELTALTSEPYVDLTLDAIAEFRGRVTREASTFRVMPGREGGDALGEVAVEPDFSAVGYPAGAALLTGGEVFLEGCKPGSRQGDRGFVEVLAALGARVAWHDGGLSVAAPADGVLRAVDLDLEAMPDQVPTLAALAPFARGTTVIRNVPNLRIKESDRLTAMATELRKAGVPAEELADGLVVPGVFADAAPPTGPVLIETWGDHRIAMAMALVGLRRPGLSLRHPHVVGKSYPAFWDDLERLQGGG